MTEPQVTFGDVERAAVRARRAKWLALLLAVAAFASGFYVGRASRPAIEIHFRVVHTPTIRT